MDRERGQEGPLKKFAALADCDRKDIQECITRIMNTLSFRKLAGKTQVILSLSGPNVRTRLTHTIEVAKIAKDICRELGLNDELADAMALAHDIGHTPFGHVGERTLREIMCGCDTLDRKVNDCDFGNSGFKHNLQSFRVLKDLERVGFNGSENEAIWSHIMWGALAHTKMSYSKTGSGMEDEIFISSKHCPWVYVCYYDEEKECKRNIQKKKRKNKDKENNIKEICKPWLCAMLPVIKSKDNVKADDLNMETTREYLKKEPIEKIYLKWIYCTNKCYMANLWRYKNENKSLSKAYSYLFDHPFPNSYYAKSIYEYFNGNDDSIIKDCISLEAQIVHQADDIAQRQQDLEDGINKGLLPFQAAKDDVESLIEKFNSLGSFKDERKNLDQCKNAEELGKLLSNFYKKALVEQTIINFSSFINDSNKEGINIYCLMSILYKMNGDSEKETKWILRELTEGTKIPLKNEIKNSWIENYFEINESRAYFYLLTYDFLEKCAKQNEYTRIIKDILSKLVKSCVYDLEQQAKEEPEELCESQTIKRTAELNDRSKAMDTYSIDSLSFQYEFMKSLDTLRKFLKVRYNPEFNDYFHEKKKKAWKNLGMLKLCSFHVFEKVMEKIFSDKEKVVGIYELLNIEVPERYVPEKHAQATFYQWKKILRGDANRALSSIVNFIDESKKEHEGRKEELKKFEGRQKLTILKSEIVEKNDGKASYILKRMFKAYITNSHQLPDLGLKYILTSLLDILDERNQRAFLDAEKKAFEDILDKLKKTMINSERTIVTLRKITDLDLFIFPFEGDEYKELEKGKSNEIKAAIEKRKELSEYFQKLDPKAIYRCLNSEKEEEKAFLKQQLRHFRGILDNPILIATNNWKSILTRGICDYMATLTDQEAVNEYEKLYAGIMELV